MIAIRGHFDGKVIIPDEPHELRAGQEVLVQIQATTSTPRTGPQAGNAKGQIWMAADFDEPLDDFADYMK